MELIGERYHGRRANIILQKRQLEFTPITDPVYSDCHTQILFLRMYKMNGPYLTGVLLVLHFSLYTCRPAANPKLVIATAANMQFAMKELVVAFSQKTAIPCEIVVGSSGKLTAQIQAGAPFDVFVSADRRYPEQLYQAGLTEASTEIYAYGQLVLWSLNPNVPPLLTTLSSPFIQHIALANPKTAPYGQAAAEVLRRQLLWDSIEHKLVYGESIAQTNQFIISGAAEIGFTALAVVQAEVMEGQGKWTIIPTEHYQPIEQGVVVLSRSKNRKNAHTFVDFLRSAEAKIILDKFGYLATVK